MCDALKKCSVQYRSSPGQKDRSGGGGTSPLTHAAPTHIRSAHARWRQAHHSPMGIQGREKK